MARPGASIRTDSRTRRPDDDGADPGLAALRQTAASYAQVREALTEERALDSQLEERVAQLATQRDALARDIEAVEGSGDDHDGSACCGVLPVRTDFRALPGLT